MREIFFLSIQSEYVQLILKGIKKWEFRENPRFGILSHSELSIGDLIFIVSISNNICIPCLCLINNILRDDDYLSYFQDYDSGHWKEAGFTQGSKQEWEYFKKNILNCYSTAIGFDMYPINPLIDVKQIQHNFKQEHWKGIGFTPAKDLSRFSIHGESVISYFMKLSRQLLEEDYSDKYVSIRFYEELNNFLCPERRKRDFTLSIEDFITVGQIIESLGIPNEEVDLILVNGKSVPFSYLLQDRDRVSVYPVFETFDI